MLDINILKDEILNRSEVKTESSIAVSSGPRWTVDTCGPQQSESVLQPAVNLLQAVPPVSQLLPCCRQLCLKCEQLLLCQLPHTYCQGPEEEVSIK